MRTLFIKFLLFVSRLALTVLLLSGCGRPETTSDAGIDSMPCLKNIGEGLTASFDINPKPVKTMSEVYFIAVLKKGEAPVTGATVTLDLSMPGMYMPANRISLSRKGEGIYEGKGVIVRCPSGRNVWRAEMVIEREGEEPVSAVYAFRVLK
jgi:hypothetical protein